MILWFISKQVRFMCDSNVGHWSNQLDPIGSVFHGQNKHMFSDATYVMTFIYFNEEILFIVFSHIHKNSYLAPSVVVSSCCSRRCFLSLDWFKSFCIFLPSLLHPFNCLNGGFLPSLLCSFAEWMTQSSNQPKRPTNQSTRGRVSEPDEHRICQPISRNDENVSFSQRYPSPEFHLQTDQEFSTP